MLAIVVLLACDIYNRNRRWSIVTFITRDKTKGHHHRRWLTQPRYMFLRVGNFSICLTKSFHLNHDDFTNKNETTNLRRRMMSFKSVKFFLHHLRMIKINWTKTNFLKSIFPYWNNLKCEIFHLRIVVEKVPSALTSSCRTWPPSRWPACWLVRRQCSSAECDPPPVAKKVVFNLQSVMDKKVPRQGGSPGLVVMDDDSCLKGDGFESRCRILDGHFSHGFVVKIVLFVWKHRK